LDRRTDDPDSSGGASPTVVTSRHDGDDITADNGQDTRPAGFMAASPVPPRTSDDSPSAPSAWDAQAALGSVAGENGKAGPGSAATDATTAADDATAQPADAAGAPAFDSSAFNAPAFGSSAFSFSPAVPASDSTGPDTWSTGPVYWSLSDPDEQSADGSPATGTPALALTEPDTGPPADQPSFSEPYTAVPPAVSWPPAAPPAPDPPAVSAAAFAWETPDPPPTSPASPARTFLRSAGSTKPPAPARPPVTVSSPQTTVPVRSPASVPVRKAPPKAVSKRSAARQAHLTIARVEPWSVMKFSFIVSLVAFVILFIVVSVLWGSLSALGVFDSLQRVVSNVTSSQGSNGVNAAKWFSASRVLGWTALLGSLNIVLITAMSTIGAVVYNLTSRLVGGVEVTLRETE
jgi:hypothetical protein